jgi:MFS family permease
VTALLVTGAVFALIALTLATTAGLPGVAREHAPIAGRLRSAMRYAHGHRPVRALFGALAAAMLFVSIPIPVEVVLAGDVLHGGASGYGALLSAWGAGAVVGSAIYARWRTVPSRVLIALGACCMGGGFVVMAIAPSLAVALAGGALAGVGNGTMFVASRTALQEAVEERWMALMMSLNESIIQGMPGAGILLGGALAAAAGPRAALAVGGAGALGTGVVAWVKLRVTGERLTTESSASRGDRPARPAYRS